MNTEQIHVFDYTISPINFMQLLSKTGQLINFFLSDSPPIIRAQPRATLALHQAKLDVTTATVSAHFTALSIYYKKISWVHFHAR